MIRRPQRSTHCISSAASDVYKRQVSTQSTWGRAAGQQVHRDLGKLLRRPALQEKHLVLLGNPHQLTQVGFGLVENGHELLAAMAHLHHAATGTMPVKQFFLCLLYTSPSPRDQA
eukprot:TRINITY_DN6885_c0_g1_i1.p4 TRINITY_DN6885_c0_g1~~TRINITY_DN6885_c0_g1_i1.p4  ORF type:complete len:115 (-),score=39.82 TRINITY_DN6885_c0_g1_i1:84-428(-)